MVFAKSSSALLLLSLSLLWFTAVVVRGEVTKKPVPLSKTKSLIAVKGVVYCLTDCKYLNRPSMKATVPLYNGLVLLRCNHTKKTLDFTTTTAKDGSFLLKGPSTISSSEAHNCMVALLLSNSVICPNPSTLNVDHDSYGAQLVNPNSTFVSNKHTYSLYTVGPLLFNPQCTP